MSGRIIIFGATVGIGSMAVRLLRYQGRNLSPVTRDENRLEFPVGEMNATTTTGNGTDIELIAVGRGAVDHGPDPGR